MRITSKMLEKRVEEINNARGMKKGDIGSFKLYHDYFGYAIDKICNAAHGVNRIYGGGESAKNCMWYINNCI